MEKNGFNVETEKIAARWPTDRQTCRQIKIRLVQTTESIYHIMVKHHLIMDDITCTIFVSELCFYGFTYFSIISEVIPATTSHITTCLKLTSV